MHTSRGVGESYRVQLPSESIGVALRTLEGRLALRPREVARALGVAHRTVESWIAEGRLPAFREGRVVLVGVWDLLGFLQTRRLRAREPAPRTLHERALRFIEEHQHAMGKS